MQRVSLTTHSRQQRVAVSASSNYCASIAA